MNSVATRIKGLVTLCVLAFALSACQTAGTERADPNRVQLSAEEVKKIFIGKPWHGPNGAFLFREDGTYTYKDFSNSNPRGTWDYKLGADGVLSEKWTSYTFFKKGSEYEYFHSGSGAYNPAIPNQELFLPNVPPPVRSSFATPEDFKPYKLVGHWEFSNNYGRHFRGDIEVAVNSIDNKGVMQGLISYDGIQTNDQCTAKSAEAEIVKEGKKYLITTKVNCFHGTSPRMRSWSLACGDDGVCSDSINLGHGSGKTVLKEKR